jgi:hypothetical protein
VREDLKRREEERQNRLWEVGWLDAPQEEPLKPSWAEVSRTYHQKRIDVPDPTSLVIIDETDRLKMSGLEQVRDIFDRGGIGLVLIGMPGIEKRLSRYPQLYSRVGFVHAFQPLKADEVRGLLREKWSPSGISLPENGIAEEAMATIIRITGGNFRLLHRLLTQIERLLKINELKEVTPQVMDMSTIGGLRDRALIGVMLDCFARVGAITDMKVQDYYYEGSRNLLAEYVVAKWRYLWQKGEPHGHDPLHQQDFPQVGPPDPSVLSQIPPRHPFPAGRTPRPARENVRVSRMVDHADRGAGRHVSGANLSGHAPDDLSVLERVMRAAGAVAPDCRKPMARAFKKNRLPAWNSSRICVAHLSSRVPRVRWSVAIR